MRKTRDVPRRQDVEDCVDSSQDAFKEKQTEMEQTTSDIDTIRSTLETLDFGGTAEGSDEVEGAIEQADDVAVAEFDQQDGELDELQERSAEYGSELEDRADTTETDLGKLSDASGKIETEVAVNELVKAKEAALRDIEFLQEQMKRARDAQEESERIQKEQQSRAKAARS